MRTAGAPGRLTGGVELQFESAASPTRQVPPGQGARDSMQGVLQGIRKRKSRGVHGRGQSRVSAGKPVVWLKPIGATRLELELTVHPIRGDAVVELQLKLITQRRPATAASITAGKGLEPIKIGFPPTRRNFYLPDSFCVCRVCGSNFTHTHTHTARIPVGGCMCVYLCACMCARMLTRMLMEPPPM
jgi:hypothetical protein